MLGAKDEASHALYGFISDSNTVISELRKESDRGAALVGVEYLDRLVEDLARAQMIGDHKHSDKLLAYPGVLNTAASRADLAFALGWIGPQIYRDLATARKIRNKFAHSHKSLHFDDPEVSQRCKAFEALKFARPYRMRKSRDQFLFEVLMLALQLTALRRQAKRPEMGADPPVNSFAGSRNRTT